MKTTLQQQEAVRVVVDLLRSVLSVSLSYEALTILRQTVQRFQLDLASMSTTERATIEAPSGAQEVLKGRFPDLGPRDKELLRRQVGGTHYLGHAIDPWAVIEAWNLDFFEGSALKYLKRYKDKGGVEDLKKLRHYIDKMEENYVTNRKPVEKGICGALGASGTPSEDPRGCTGERNSRP